MFDPKISGITAAVAFGISFLIGLISGVSFWVLLLRAFLMGVLFFVLSGIAYWLITQYLPELMQTGRGTEGTPSLEEEGPPPGSRVNITLEGEGEELSPAAALSAEEEGLEEMVSPGGAPNPEKALDQMEEGEYTKQGVASSDVADAGLREEPMPALPPGIIDDVDELPDLESMADSFITPGVEEEEEVSNSSRRDPGGKGTKGKGGADSFDPKEMAMAIQTLLKKDQKG
ncbi:MAG TPA: hypothetical protein PLW34_05795 [Termitinemataceae bacterium]|uniref:hypothetical protein n=1 Tax=Treponema sp. J25 TaxID=2094121 RepID=UPI00104FD95F|nr:hypothetical protein [Treponema sp. J25]TCW60297.1 hypothetical protein C5O22_12215 [Treponema sp. J25]HOJ99052.1 hypothetical protein [Termitinemataceae bacterium]HOM22934.1 hypothetical protein [Termitinemataceae bacterium]HPQ00275.1 hypothetical protein [Termitinemataceae bacterium]